MTLRMPAGLIDGLGAVLRPTGVWAKEWLNSREVSSAARLPAPSLAGVRVGRTIGQ